MVHTAHAMEHIPVHRKMWLYVNTIPNGLFHGSNIYSKSLSCGRTSSNQIRLRHFLRGARGALRLFRSHATFFLSFT